MQIIFVYLTFIYQIIILPQVILIVIGIVSDLYADNTNNPFSENIFFLYSVVVSNFNKRSLFLFFCAHVGSRFVRIVDGGVSVDSV